MTRQTTYIYIESDFQAEKLNVVYGRRYEADRKQLEKILSFTSVKHLYHFLNRKHTYSLPSYSKFCKILREEQFYFCDLPNGRNYVVIKSIVNPEQ